jgi:hypothetical protein
MSLRGIEWVFTVCRKTVLRWIEKQVASLPRLVEMLLPALDDEVLELGELVTFVSEKFSSVGCGRPPVAARAKSWLLPSGIVRKTPVA